MSFQVINEFLISLGVDELGGCEFAVEDDVVDKDGEVVFMSSYFVGGVGVGVEEGWRQVFLPALQVSHPY